MWLLHLLPDAFLEWIVNIILLSGIIGSFISFVVLNRILRYFPALASYYRIAQVVSAVVLVAGIYFKGGYSAEMIWRERVAEAQKQVEEANQRADKINQTLDAERKKKQKTITEYAITVQERIVEKEKIINADCRVNPEAVQIINDAARGGTKK
jgi:hypothetical protein